MWYPSKMRTFWAYFEEKQPRNRWDVAKMICYSKIQLCSTSHNCIFWVLDNFCRHKNFMGSYYTLYTIVYNWFYVWNTTKIPVLVGLNRTEFSFYEVWTSFFGLAIIGNRLQLWTKKLDQTGPLNTRYTQQPQLEAEFSYIQHQKFPPNPKPNKYSCDTRILKMKQFGWLILGLCWLVTSLKPTSISHVKTCLKCIPQMGVKFLLWNTVKYFRYHFISSSIHLAQY